MALLQTLTADFNDNLLPATLALWSSGDATVSTGQLRFTSATTATYKGLASVSTYDFSGSYAFAQVTDVLSGLTLAGTFFQISLDGNNSVTMFVYHGELRAEKADGAVFTTVQTATYNATNHAWWRISNPSGNNITYEVSSDGVTWSTFATTTATFAKTALTLSIFIGTDGVNAGTDTAAFDNLNVAPTTTIIPADTSWTFGADSPSLTQNHVLQPADTSWTFTADATTIAQAAKPLTAFSHVSKPTVAYTHVSKPQTSHTSPSKPLTQYS